MSDEPELEGELSFEGELSNPTDRAVGGTLGFSGGLGRSARYEPPKEDPPSREVSSSSSAAALSGSSVTRSYGDAAISVVGDVTAEVRRSYWFDQFPNEPPAHIVDPSSRNRLLATLEAFEADVLEFEVGPVDETIRNAILLPVQMAISALRFGDQIAEQWGSVRDRLIAARERIEGIWEGLRYSKAVATGTALLHLNSMYDLAERGREAILAIFGL